MREDLKDTFSRYVLEWYRKPLEKAVKNSKRFHEITSIEKMAKRASQYLSLGNRAGEGWFLTADMIDLLYHECRGVVCLQPLPACRTISPVKAWSTNCTPRIRKPYSWLSTAMPVPVKSTRQTA